MVTWESDGLSAKQSREEQSRVEQGPHSSAFEACLLLSSVRWRGNLDT